MFTLPRLIEEDIARMHGALVEFLDTSGATVAVIVDQGGFVICSDGLTDCFDITSVAALSAAAYHATQAIAGIVNEPNFSMVYQQGDQYSLFIATIDQQCLFLVLFKSLNSMGAIKYLSIPTRRVIAEQLQLARERTPDDGFDLSMMNVANPAEVFKRKG